MSDYLSHKLGRRINLEYVSSTIIRISTTVEIFIFGIKPNVRLEILEVNSKMLKMKYSGSWGVRKLILWTLKYLKTKDEDLINSITLYDNNRVLLDLDKITKIRKVLLELEPLAIEFKEEGINIITSLRI